jgi:predicted TIM-barrel fold metal-dependent hydrolase
MAILATRYLEGKFLMAHFGGNWEWGLRAIAHLPNVWADFSGTINEFGAYELALKLLGDRRVVFGSDLSADFWGNAGRVLQAKTDQQVLDRIFHGNFLDMLNPEHRDRFRM